MNDIRIVAEPDKGEAGYFPEPLSLLRNLTERETGVAAAGDTAGRPVDALIPLRPLPDLVDWNRWWKTGFSRLSGRCQIRTWRSIEDAGSNVCVLRLQQVF